MFDVTTIISNIEKYSAKSWLLALFIYVVVTIIRSERTGKIVDLFIAWFEVEIEATKASREILQSRKNSTDIEKTKRNTQPRRKT